MSLFRRIKNIITSNINHKEEDINIDINSYEDIYYSDSKTIPNENNQFEKKYYNILEADKLISSK